jgi:hypothetical protein
MNKYTATSAKTSWTMTLEPMLSLTLVEHDELRLSEPKTGGLSSLSGSRVPARPAALAIAASAHRMCNTASFVSAAWLLALRQQTMRWATIGDERIITL